jgi:hypothetical protein
MWPPRSIAAQSFVLIQQGSGRPAVSGRLCKGRGRVIAAMIGLPLSFWLYLKFLTVFFVLDCMASFMRRLWFWITCSASCRISRFWLPLVLRAASLPFACSSYFVIRLSVVIGSQVSFCISPFRLCLMLSSAPIGFRCSSSFSLHLPLLIPPPIPLAFNFVIRVSAMRSHFAVSPSRRPPCGALPDNLHIRFQMLQLCGLSRLEMWSFLDSGNLGTAGLPGNRISVKVVGLSANSGFVWISP